MIDVLRFKPMKVLPTVYDDALSYYETLGKIVETMNKLIEKSEETDRVIADIIVEISRVQEWISNFSTEYAKEVLQENIATMIFVEISDSGYVIYHIPENWDSIEFNTTGLDIDIECVEDFGKLVLSY